jgi:hypothetical protein
MFSGKPLVHLSDLAPATTRRGEIHRNLPMRAASTTEATSFWRRLNCGNGSKQMPNGRLWPTRANASADPNRSESGREPGFLPKFVVSEQISHRPVFFPAATVPYCSGSTRNA